MLASGSQSEPVARPTRTVGHLGVDRDRGLHLKSHSSQRHQPALNGTLLDERALNVNEARPRKRPGSLEDQRARVRSGGRRW